MLPVQIEDHHLVVHIDQSLLTLFCGLKTSYFHDCSRIKYTNLHRLEYFRVSSHDEQIPLNACKQQRRIFHEKTDELLVRLIYLYRQYNQIIRHL